LIFITRTLLKIALAVLLILESYFKKTEYDENEDENEPLQFSSILAPRMSHERLLGKNFPPQLRLS